MSHKMTLAKWCLIFSIFSFSFVFSAWAAPFNPPTPSMKANGNLICAAGRLDPTRLAMFYYTSDRIAGAFPAGLDDFMAALRSPDSQSGDRRTIANAINTQVQIWIGLPASGFQIATPPGIKVVPPFFAASFDQLVVHCNKTNGPAQVGAPPKPAPGAPAQQTASANPAPPPPPSVPAPANPLANLRVRATPDALLTAPSDPLFKTAAAATVSFSENGPTRTTTNVLTAAVGYDLAFHSPSDLVTYDVVPFVAVDRSIAVTSGKPSAANRENVMLGVTGAITNLFHPGGSSSANTLSATYEHIWNDIDDSGLEFIHFLDQPILSPYINNYLPFLDGAALGKEPLGFTVLFDLRADLGFYSTPAMKASTTRNYQQLGSDFGIDIAFPAISSDLRLTELLMAEIQTYRKGVSYFDAEWTYNITTNAGIKAGYQNGNLETTGQRVQQWLLSLSLKF